MLRTALFRPLAALLPVLGHGFKTDMQRRASDERVYQRSWPCGCRATYKNERERSALWFPCDEHFAWGADH